MNVNGLIRCTLQFDATRMSLEKTDRLTESPRKPTHLHVSRKLSRGGDDDDDIYDMEEYYNLQERRGSSQSMSRYNSCPQLADVEQDLQLQPCYEYETTVDDINTTVGAMGRDLNYVTNSRSPLLQRKLYLENGQVSDTPTPPSTPKSRRSIVSSRDSILSSPDKPFVTTSPFASPRLLLRKQMKSSALNRDSSVDSFGESSMKHSDLSVDNVNALDELNTGDLAKRRESCKGKAPLVTVTHHTGDSETLNKCETWLQTLNIAKQDRIKSRSHIQLPPIQRPVV